MWSIGKDDAGHNAYLKHGNQVILHLMAGTEFNEQNAEGIAQRLKLLETLKRVVLDSAYVIAGCPDDYGLIKNNTCAGQFAPAWCRDCWQAAITQEGGEADV